MTRIAMTKKRRLFDELKQGVEELKAAREGRASLREEMRVVFSASEVDDLLLHFRAITEKVPLKPIQTEAEYAQAVAVLNALLDLPESSEGRPLAALLVALGEYIGYYEDSRNKHIGSSFDDFLAEEGRLEDATRTAEARIAQMRGRTWNYRVIETGAGDETSRAIHEVHYEDGVPVAYTENPAPIVWESDDEEPKRVLERMREALDKPVLREEDFKP
jgi:hypothetical protein